jgi:hypothetical protein
MDGFVPQVAASLNTRRRPVSRLATFIARDSTCLMALDDLLRRYFAATNMAAATPAVVEAGLDRLHVDFGLETDPGRRFALWCLMHMLGQAPDLDVAFEKEADRDAAREFMDLLAATETRP